MNRISCARLESSSGEGDPGLEFVAVRSPSILTTLSAVVAIPSTGSRGPGPVREGPGEGKGLSLALFRLPVEFCLERLFLVIPDVNGPSASGG